MADKNTCPSSNCQAQFEGEPPECPSCHIKIDWYGMRKAAAETAEEKARQPKKK